MTQTAPIPVLRPETHVPRTASARNVGVVLAVVSALSFSLSGPLVKPLLEAGWSLSAVLFIRMGLAGLVLSPALVKAIRAQSDFLKRHGRTLLIFGLFPVAGCQLLYFSAMQRMPVAVALLIQYLAPVMLVGYVWLRTRLTPSKLVLIGSFVAVLGLVLVVDVSGASFDLLGTVLALGAAVCVCIYFVMAERAGDELPALALAAGGLLVGAAVMGLTALFGLIPWASPEVTVLIRGIEVPGIVPLLFVGLIGTSLGYALGILAVPRTGSRLASFVGLSEVLFALLFAWLLLGEKPTGVQMLGGLVLLCGVVLVRLSADQPAAETVDALIAQDAV